MNNNSFGTERICPVCTTAIEKGDVIKICPSCKTAFHEECWKENKGCATYGCPQVKVLDPPMKINVTNTSTPYANSSQAEILQQLREILARGEINQTTYQRIYNEITSAPQTTNTNSYNNRNYNQQYTHDQRSSKQIATDLDDDFFVRFFGAPQTTNTNSYDNRNYNQQSVPNPKLPDSIETGIPYFDVWIKCTDFQGRSRRKEYWTFTLMNFVIFFLLGGFIAFTTELNNSVGQNPNTSASGVANMLYYIFGFAVILPSLSVTVRRLHDVGMSGWLVLIGIIPYIGWLILLILASIDGQAGMNKWGPNPKNI
ncbi:MAG: DUF805 domain-containing protein [Planctomycetaceae bacterium]|jgi:uncharacterized membrane protein YhaH (DUF805 family)|nr:DUF805 domain-containing protein [Planctomycetaceae bacterium]